MNNTEAYDFPLEKSDKEIYKNHSSPFSKSILYMNSNYDEENDLPSTY